MAAAAAAAAAAAVMGCLAQWRRMRLHASNPCCPVPCYKMLFLCRRTASVAAVAAAAAAGKLTEHLLPLVAAGANSLPGRPAYRVAPRSPKQLERWKIVGRAFAGSERRRGVLDGRLSASFEPAAPRSARSPPRPGQTSVGRRAKPASGVACRESFRVVVSR